MSIKFWLTRSYKIILVLNVFAFAVISACAYCQNADFSEKDWAAPFLTNQLFADPSKNPFIKCNDEIGFPLKKVIQEGIHFYLTDCKPEIIYSWGNENEYKKIIDDLRKAQSWDDLLINLITTSTLYFSLTPVSTFNYGEASIRLKLKANLRYEYVSGLNSWADPCLTYKKFKNYKNRVYVFSKPLSHRTGSRTYELILCSADVIHSISMFTKEHYDESLRDLYVQGVLHNGYGYIQDNVSGKVVKAFDINLANEEFLMAPILWKEKKKSSFKLSPSPIQLLDGFPTTRTKLYENMGYFWSKASVTSNETLVINPLLPQLRESHFEIKSPLYFH
jgi:hypothetical protein